MKKEPDSELRAEYDFSTGVRGKYAERYRQGPVRTRERRVSVFLAHGPSDRFFARKIAERLREHGVLAWAEEAEVGAGESLRARLAAVIGDVEYLAVVLSRDSAASEWVRTELPDAARAELAKHHVPTLVFLVEPVEVPPFLRDRFCADFTTPEHFEESFPRLLSGIGALLEPLGQTRDGSAPEPERAGPFRRAR